jgi:alpha-glucosidase
MKLKILLLFIFFSSTGFGQGDMRIDLLPGEKIWSGIIKDGHRMPYPTGYRYDFYANNQENQIQPLLLGNKGLWVWSEEPFAFEIQDGKIIIFNAMGEVKYGHAGGSLSEARKYASANFFPASGQMPDELLFSKPQYNTWIELTYNQNQTDVLKYAQAILDNGFLPGVLMIDDTWQEDYGLWRFHPGRFPNPRQMIDQLHQMGFKVMLWICPFVSADQYLIVSEIMKGKGFLMQKKEVVGVGSRVYTDLYTSWKENVLKFENAPFEEVIKKMERWYDVKITVDKSVDAKERYTMTIKTESLREMLALLSKTTKCGLYPRQHEN